MRENPTFGPNRTGGLAAPGRTREMIESSERYGPANIESGRPLHDAEIEEYVGRDGPVGHVPPPLRRPTEIDDDELALLADKLGARLAFERSGVRLYEALIAKLEAYESYEGGPSRGDLERIRDQELRHFHAVASAMVEIGCDPTAVTPSADLEARIGHGVCAVLTDPRTSLVDGLEAILAAELIDTEQWSALVDLLRAAGLDRIADRFAPFHAEEEEHVDQVRSFLSAARSAPSTH
jgi:hypothetical protein